MMRVVSLVLVCLSLAVVSAQAGGGEKQVRQEKNRSSTMEQALARLASKQLHLKEPMGEIPTTLAEAHAELERILTDESLARVDAMESEDGTNLSHHGLGANMRQGWGLWGCGAIRCWPGTWRSWDLRTRATWLRAFQIPNAPC